MSVTQIKLGTPVLTFPANRSPDGTIDAALIPVGSVFHGRESAWAASPNRAYILIMQGDGNLVLYKAIGQNPAPAPGAVMTVQPLWASNTTGRSAEYFAVQDDGNLVIYTAKNEAVWSSGTQGDWLSGLYLQTNGNLVLYKLAPAWGTNTAQK